MIPTFGPTPSPTDAPSDSPSLTPSVNPTTDEPTSGPTVLPTPLPTPAPSPLHAEWSWEELNTGHCKDSDGRGYNYCTKKLDPSTGTFEECQAEVNTLDETMIQSFVWSHYPGGIIGGRSWPVQESCIIDIISLDACTSADPELSSSGWGCVCQYDWIGGPPEAYSNSDQTWVTCYERVLPVPVSTEVPSVAPIASSPSANPSMIPTFGPTPSPTDAPSDSPSLTPSVNPTTDEPTSGPTVLPTPLPN